MKKTIKLDILYKALTILSICMTLSLIWAITSSSIELIHKVAMQLLPGSILFCLLYIILALLCWFKWKISFLYSFLLNGYNLIVFAPLGYTILNFFDMTLQPKISMILLILSFLISIIGIIVIIKNYITPSRLINKGS